SRLRHRLLAVANGAKSAFALGQSLALAWLRSLRHSAGRRRLVIVVAATLVCAYAVGVFGHVMTTPDLGLRFAFSRFVNRVYPGFLVAPEGESVPDLGNAEIVQIGDERIDTWLQLLR